MQRISYFGLKRSNRPLASFTLIELLVVIAIIGILAALTLFAAQGVMNMAARSRAKGEIQAMSTALESYKTDNGAYPSVNTLASTNVYATVDPSTAGNNYQLSSQLLYQALASKINFTDTALSAASPATGKAYMSFKTTQLGNYKPGSGSTYIQDPWNYSYGYNTGDNAVPQANPPYSGTGFFDLWSTGGLVGAKETNINTWISNWAQ